MRENKQHKSDTETSYFGPWSFFRMGVSDEDVFNFTSMDAIFKIGIVENYRESKKIQKWFRHISMTLVSVLKKFSWHDS